MFELTCKEERVGDLLGGDNSFLVPDYQRPYSWTDVEVGELWEDLSLAFGDNHEEVAPYFLGSIVLSTTEQEKVFELIDGQQRLTTLTVLLACIRKRLPKEKAAGISLFLYDEGNEFKSIPPRYRLTLRSRDNELFRTAILEPNGIDLFGQIADQELEDPQRNLIENSKYLLEKIDEFPPDRLSEFAKFLAQQVTFVKIIAPDRDYAVKIFVTLNDRGLDLSFVDVLKSEILAAIPDPDRPKYVARWEALESDLGREQFEGVFSDIRMIHTRRKLKTTVEKEFRDSVQPLKNPKLFFQEWLEPMCRAVSWITDHEFPSQTLGQPINRLLFWLSEHADNADWYPSLSYFLVKNEGKAQTVLDFLQAFDRFVSGLMFLRATPSERIRRHAQVIREIAQGLSPQRPGGSLALTPEECSKIKSFLNGPIYAKPWLAQYALLRLDERLSAEGAKYDHAVISVEHVLPQSPKPSSKWMIWWNNEAIRLEATHRIGNLVLLNRRKNTSASNSEFDDKKLKYFRKGGISTFAITTQVLNETEWTPAVFEKRQNELLKLLTDLWQLG